MQQRAFQAIGGGLRVAQSNGRIGISVVCIPAILI
jgi:hypothetical protein